MQSTLATPESVVRKQKGTELHLGASRTRPLPAMVPEFAACDVNAELAHFAASHARALTKTSSIESVCQPVLKSVYGHLPEIQDLRIRFKARSYLWGLRSLKK